jgi:pimeloyl-ACP methyl ester carboxylesterase
MDATHLTGSTTMLNVFSEGEGAIHTSDGVRIFFRTEGEGPTTLLFMHGWGGNGSGSLWDPVLRRLSHKDLRLILVDLRGHGRSEHTSQGFTTERFAEDILEVADHLGARKLILVAYSMSGRWAQWLSLSRPDRIVGQILLGPAPASAMPLSQEVVDDWLERVRTRESYHEFESQFTRIRLTEDELDECFAAVRSSPEHSLRETLRMCSEPGFAEPRFTEQLAAAHVPTVVLAGLHDPLMTPEYLRREVVCRIPGARMALLDCGHNLPLEMPMAVAAIIEAFVAGVTGSSAGNSTEDR